MSDKYRARRFAPVADYNSYAAIAATLKADKERSRLCGPGYEEIHAPQSDSPRPRAQKCCYNKNTETLMIIMTDPGEGGRPRYTWVQYDQVSEDMWEDLKGGISTNDFVNDALSSTPWEITSYGRLPRTRTDSFDLGFEEYL